MYHSSQPITGQTVDVLNFGAIADSVSALPTGRTLFLRRHELAAINGSDGNVFLKHNLWADFQQIAILIRDEPFVRTV